MSQFNGFLGVSPAESGYQFAVWAPNASSVSLVGEFNHWDDKQHPMEQAEQGMWWLETSALNNGDEYKFAITGANGTQLKNDPRARKLTNSAGNGVIFDDNYEWKNTDFTSPTLATCIIYELHIGTFAATDEEKGTFDSAIEKLPELQKLGVTMVELMPVNEFAGDISWGYNPAYPFAVEEAYGGPQGLKRFIDAAHGMGIGVILDVVYNHLGPSDLDLWQFDGWSENDKGGIYFFNDARSATPWGDTRPDYGRKEVRQYLIDNALMWLREFRADGLRLDMVPYMRGISGADTGEDDIPEAYELIKQLNQTVGDTWPDKIVIAEDLHNHAFITAPIDQDGCGFTAQWDAAFVHPVRHALIQSNEADINLQTLAEAITGQQSARLFSRVIYTESHDEVANGSARLVEEVAPGNVDESFFARQKGVLAGAIVLTSPGIPMLFQGQDFMEDGWFDDNDALDWQRKATFGEFADAFGKLVALRRNSDGNSASLVDGETDIIHKDDDNKVIGFKRRSNNAAPIFVYLSFSSQSFEQYQLEGLPDHPHCLFAWQDGEATDAITLENDTLTLSPYSVIILSPGNIE